MVHVTFYNTYSNRNVINKALTSQITTTAELYDNTNVLNPELKMAWDNKYVTTANYFYIQEFNRYYFLEDVVAEPGGAARVKGSIDVLYTYKNSIGQDRIVVTRAKYSKPGKADISGLFDVGSGPTYIKDSQLPVKPNRDIRVYEFTQGTPYLLDDPYFEDSGYFFVLNVMGRYTNGGEGE